VSYSHLIQNVILISKSLAIKNRAKTIQKKCETLLINIYKKSNQLKQPEQSRFEYIQYLNKRFNEQIEQEKNIENLYDKIERMQYDLYQKIGTIYSRSLLDQSENRLYGTNYIYAEIFSKIGLQKVSY